MSRLLTIFLSIIISTSFVTANNQSHNLTMSQKRHVADSLNRQLALTDSPKDSLSILYNLFDVSTRDKARKIGLKIFDVAGRIGNTEAQNDILRQTSNISSRIDSIHMLLIGKARTLPDNDDRKETITFIRMNLMRDRLQGADDQERQKYLRDLLSQFTHDKPEDIYEQIIITYSICSALGFSANPSLSVRYLNELLGLIKQLPPKALSVRNLAYTRGSILYNEIGDYTNALKLDRKILNVIDSLEATYEQNGRIYRNYDVSRYARYMSLLFNYPIMTDEEVEEAYAKARYHAVRDSDALETLRKTETPTICYLMAKKRYNEVAPILLKQIPSKYHIAHRRRFFKYLLEASDSINNPEAYNYAAKEYIQYLEKYLQQRDYEKYRELQVLYDVYDLRAAKDHLEIESRHHELKNQRTLIIVTVISLLILGGFLAILLRLYRKARKLSKNLIGANDALIEESSNLMAARDELIRSRDEAREANNRNKDVISNIHNEVKVPLQAVTEYSRLIVDCIDINKQPFLAKYADLVEFNTELLNRVIDDVLSLSELDSNRMAVTYYGANVNQMCEMAISSMAHRVSPDVELKFIPGDASFTVSTDPRRVEQVLISLLSNAAKFTEKGSITLSYEVEHSANRLVFIIADTGIGIPADKSEVIFKRFVKLDRNTQGPGLGLTIDRMIARLIGGDVRLDTSYTRGACFRFFIPMTRN